MRPEDADAAYLVDMLTAVDTVAEFVKGNTYSQYAGDKLLQSAVERQIEIVGEAARKVSDTFRAYHTQIPWRLIIAQRHVLAHDYGRIEHDRIWRVITLHLPELATQLRPLIPPPPID